MKKLMNYLRFDESYGEFELYESESGSPGAQTKKTIATKLSPLPPKGEISRHIRENEQRLKTEFYSEKNPDVLFRHFLIGNILQALAVCINGMASSEQINDYLLRQSMRPDCLVGMGKNKARFLLDHIFALTEAHLSTEYGETVTGILAGKTAVFIEGEQQAILLDTRGFEHRSIGAPENEKVVRGPQEGFNESIRTNITLLRRIIKTPDFVCEFVDSGAQNGVAAVIAYKAKSVNPNLLRKVRGELSSVSARMLLNGGMLERITERHKYSPFPQTLYTERPDRAAAHILEGHVAVLLEGSPSACIMPATLSSLMSTSEDAYMRRPLSAVLRAVRYIGAGLSIILPGYFMAVALHHPGMMSTEKLATLISSRRMVVFPLGIEMLFLLWIFHLLREAGIRVPGSAGQAIGIIGGLILGQAAVAANMVSTVVLIYVALSGLGTFTIPDYSTQLAAEYLRLFLFALGWIGGLLGLSLGVLVAGAWLASLKSYGVPFLSPFSPKTNKKGQIMPEDYTNTNDEAEATIER